MNDVILNWKKLKKIIKFERTDNCINGRDRGYTDKEILKILEFADQRFKTAILILASADYKPTVQEMLNEYLKAVNLLTINEENRLKQKVETLEIKITTCNITGR